MLVRLLAFAGNRFIVTEKSLELNITHELMAGLGVTPVGFSQQQELSTGADVYFPVDPPLILQYKRAYDGRDLVQGRFRINSNQGNTQHRVLDLVSRRGLCDAYYVFPLIIHNGVFLQSFGVFSDNSVFIPPEWITNSVGNRSSNWMLTSHLVTVDISSQSFTVRSSEEGEGKGLSKVKMLERVRERHNSRDLGEQGDLASYVEGNIQAMREVVREAGILRRSEHTISYLVRRGVKNERTMASNYVTATVQL